MPTTQCKLAGQALTLTMAPPSPQSRAASSFQRSVRFVSKLTHWSPLTKYACMYRRLTTRLSAVPMSGLISRQDSEPASSAGASAGKGARGSKGDKAPYAEGGAASQLGQHTGIRLCSLCSAGASQHAACTAQHSTHSAPTCARPRLAGALGPRGRANRAQRCTIEPPGTPVEGQP